MKKTIIIYATFALLFCGNPFAASNVRVKDVAQINGVQELQVFGYGLVVGLAGTGDRSNTIFTAQTMKSMLKNMGIELPERQITMRNVAAVMVTGTVDPFKKRGTRIDIIVSSIGDARSLEGGTLIMTPLMGPDGEIYASAQGALSTGGYDIRSRGVSRMTQNHTLVGRVPDGAIIQREYLFNDFSSVDLALSLDKPDFTSAVAMATAINGYMLGQFGLTRRIAQAIDASTVTLNYDLSSQEIGTEDNPLALAEFISFVENVTFDMATSAKVVMNERTGTIVAGGNVRISQVSLTHGGIKVEISNKPAVIQPMPFTFGRTQVIPNPEVVIEQKDMDMVVLDETTTASDLAQALNSLGVASRDIIQIFQAIKEAGALQAQLVIM
ncbi:MAG: flagellar basal body P-ring protein FlgI [Chitinivibrionia bacterium]|nr:flagellar basal body P-ring protein FlgI [Chitinivibrionia bacterium]